METEFLVICELVLLKIFLLDSFFPLNDNNYIQFLKIQLLVSL